MGTFVTARTDQYRLNAVPWRPGKDTVAFGRELGGVSVSEGERRAHRVDLIEEVSARRGGPSDIPELATTKPILSGIEVADDGRFIVLVSRTAKRVADEWIAPDDLDIVGIDGRYQGRIVQPDGFTAWYLVGDTLWGIAVDADGVQSVRRYTVTWTARPPD
jgi:hypothetical protein